LSNGTKPRADIVAVSLEQLTQVVAPHAPTHHQLYLGGRAPHILGPWTFRSLPDIELDAVTLTQIVDSLAIHGTLVKEIFLP
jgi:hypothetical protein